MEALHYVLIILLGVLTSAFFAGAETGLISLNRVRLRHEVERKNRRAIILNGFVENSERLLGTTLFGTNLANVLVGVYASMLAVRLFQADVFWVELVAAVVASGLLLVFGEIVPKTLFRHYAHRLCMTIADLLNAMAWLCAPMVSFVGFFMHVFVRLSGGKEAPKSFFVTREELKHLAKEGEVGGALTADEREMIDGVFDFPYKTVYDVMVPMSKTSTITRDVAVAELFALSQQTGFARFPVRDGDKIVGVVNVYEIVFENTGGAGKTVEQLMQKPQFVATTERVNRVLPVLRASRHPISIVVSPEGKHVGIVTIEDIVEEIVGDVEG
ncbi:MAG TPA: hemolysin family protein [Verrucomicrobiae bacterium]|nr:hemolysin family protein [Verrucomicrobiae bacterium]